MGCRFFACFSSCKNKKHQHEANQAVQSNKEEDFGIPFNSITVKKEKLGELLNNSGKNKVTFDLNVKTREEVLPVESSDKLLKNDEDKKESEGCSVLDLNTSSVVCCKSQNNRYQNIAESEDELEDLDLEINDCNEDELEDLDLEINDLDDCNEDELEDLDLDDCNEDDIGMSKNEPRFDIEETSESLFSLSIESRKQVCEEVDEKEVNSPIPIGLKRNGKDKDGQYVQSVLNPVENLAQWKQVKAKASIPLKHEEKENINLEQGFGILISPEPSFKFATLSSKLCSDDKKLVGKETAVDTSLSSWLVNTPNSKASTNSVGNSVASHKTNSPRNHEGRPILGALTMEELKQHSTSTSPRKCRSRSPYETPIIGTVGSYWSHTRQIVETDSSSPRTRSRNIQIPFEARLERALDTGIAGV